MTDPTRTHLAMLLDRSGSMRQIRGATEEGFNTFVAEQLEAEGAATMTLAQFDHEYQEVYVDRPLQEVPRLSLEPRGRTALLDSIARLVTDTGARLAALPEDQRPGTVIVGIMTDGLENSSAEYDHAAIKEMITHQEQAYQWTFLYLGANQDAIEVGAQLGVAAERSMTYSDVGTADALGATSKMVRGMRSKIASGAAPAAARDAAGYSEGQRERASRKHD